MRVFLAVACVCFMPVASAQDPVKVDPTHYTVVSENDRVRVLKVHYGPHEKSVMHHHPASVAVYLTDGLVLFTSPDGMKRTAGGKAGEARYISPITHLPENIGDSAIDFILIELKDDTPTSSRNNASK